MENLIPTEKDIVSVTKFDMNGSTFYGNNSPFASKARRMASLIKDKSKLIRRAKAVITVWGTKTYYGYSRGASGNPVEHEENVWIPFENALKNMGLSGSEINEIKNYKHMADTHNSLFV